VAEGLGVAREGLASHCHYGGERGGGKEKPERDQLEGGSVPTPILMKRKLLPQIVPRSPKRIQSSREEGDRVKRTS